MGHPQVTDGGVGFQIWRVAANILNAQPGRDEKSWSSRLRDGRELTTHHRKEKITYYDTLHRDIDFLE
jgi:hypothetical protein